MRAVVSAVSSLSFAFCLFTFALLPVDARRLVQRQAEGRALLKAEVAAVERERRASFGGDSGRLRDLNPPDRLADAARRAADRVGRSADDFARGVADCARHAADGVPDRAEQPAAR